MSTGCEDLNLERHFETLGVSGDASISAVKKAARKLFLKHHPDLNPGDRAECEEKTKRIVEAYRALLSAMKPGAADGKAADAAVESGDTGSLDIFVFEVSRFSMAVPAGCVREVLRFKDVRIDDFGVGAGAAPHLTGVFSRGGEVTMLWNLHSQFGLREMMIGSDLGNSKILIVAFEGAAVSFPVDDVKGIMSFSKDALMASSTEEETDISYFEGIINTDGGPIGLLDLKKVLFE